MPAKYKPGICIDFDGVIHSYTSPWLTATEIPDPPVPGAFEAIARYINAGFLVHIHSCRCSTRPAIRAIRAWFLRNGGEVLLRHLKFAERKPKALLYIDDRGFRFEGAFPTPEEILAFKPWNKRAQSDKSGNCS
jgi:hypothetical protein